VELKAHVEACRHCRLEVRQLVRFADVERDTELAEEADWEGHELALQRSYAEGVRGENTSSPRRRASRLLWLVPAAAAALLLFMALPDRIPEPSGGNIVFRGDGGSTPLTGLAPTGELSATPAAFSWQADGEFDTYRLEIFTPSLAVIFRADDIAESPFAAPDSLRALFSAGETYLWKVTALVGIETAAVSDNAWFTITPAD
jgi:hypothetical protein